MTWGITSKSLHRHGAPLAHTHWPGFAGQESLFRPSQARAPLVIRGWSARQSCCVDALWRGWDLLDSVLLLCNVPRIIIRMAFAQVWMESQVDHEQQR